MTLGDSWIKYWFELDRPALIICSALSLEQNLQFVGGKKCLKTIISLCRTSTGAWVAQKCKYFTKIRFIISKNPLYLEVFIILSKFMCNNLPHLSVYFIKIPSHVRRYRKFVVSGYLCFRRYYIEYYMNIQKVFDEWYCSYNKNWSQMLQIDSDKKFPTTSTTFFFEAKHFEIYNCCLLHVNVIIFLYNK